MDVAYEDRKLHDDGIFDGLMGYKEWIHYQGTFFVNGKPLALVMGFPRSYTGMGAFGWISFDGNQYSLAGNKDTDKNGFFDLQRIPVHFSPSEPGYILQYTAEPEPHKVYDGTMRGAFPDYAIEVKTPDLDITIELSINSSESIYQKEVFQWMPFKKRVASWFHSGDVAASLKGTIAGRPVTTDINKNRGWYERMWSKVVVLWPSEWLWFMAHLDNGAVFDLYTAKSAGMRMHPLDECWLYDTEVFHEFSHYEAEFPEDLKGAIQKRDYSEIVGKCIVCRGKNGGNSFDITATVTDFRQYEFRDYTADIKYTNFIFETDGKALIDGNAIDMKGRGAAERAPIKYWWL
jgi:hypothetical protein